MTEHTTPPTLYKPLYDSDALLPNAGLLRENPFDLGIVGEIGVVYPNFLS
jgi:hypothetical protein